MSLKERVDRHDREIAAIRKLILTGMRMIQRANERMDRRDLRVDGELETIRKDIRELATMRKDIRELAAAQRETDRMLKSLIRSLERGGNGHGSAPPAR
jgi:hypothetical protein